MAVQHLYFDKTELVAMIAKKKKYVTKNIPYNQIQSVNIKKGVRKVFFFIKKEYEVIEINTRTIGIICYYSYKEKYFDEYKKGIERFCMDNRITLNKKGE